ARGSWNTRATRSARSHTGFRVTSTPSSSIVPVSTGKSPDIAFRNVDLPAPLEPMTVTNWPVGISSDRPRSARVSIGVPALKVICKSCARNMSAPLSAEETALEHRKDERHGDQRGCHQIQILSLQADKVAVERQRNEKAIQHRPQDD